MKLTDQQRAELKALADAATPGPWRIGSLESYDGYSSKPYRNVWQGQDDEARIIARAILDQGNEQTDVDADAMFIAAAREAVPTLLADLGEEKTRTSHYKDVAERINSELELVREEKEIVRGFVTERDGIISKLQAELERLRELAATAEKWRGIASARHGDGRAVSEIRREAAEEEREACAQIAAKHEFGAIAAYSIRARNEKGSS